ncbi:MAG: hypothetical protein ABIH37_02685 [archaeon]
MKEFRYDSEQAKECPEFLQYLEELDTSNNPFQCKHLRVLPEDVKILRTAGVPSRYENGDLICLDRVKKTLHARCGTSSAALRPGKDGTYEALCRNGLVQLTVEIKSVEDSKFRVDTKSRKIF